MPLANRHMERWGAEKTSENLALVKTPQKGKTGEGTCLEEL
jgi:hypothetical protein